MHVAIIGNGIAGVTAARWLRKLDDSVRITLISAETEFFFSRTALMYVYMGHQRFEDLMPYEPWFWEKNRIDLVKKYVAGIDTGDKKLNFSDGDAMSYDKLIVACGSKWNKFGWPGQDLGGVGGMVSVQDLQYLEDRSEDIERAVVVGGGLIGIELAEMLHSRHVPVSLLVREESYWSNALPPEESRMVSRHIKHHGIDLRENTELAEIHDDGRGSAGAITTKGGERLDCQFVGLTAGVSPNVEFLKSSGIELKRGILVDGQLRTSAPDVYAIGDCAELRAPRPGRKAIEAVWYTGRMMGETVAHNVLGKRIAYDPGIWFNSAKFLDIEYQVYGEVPAKMDPAELSTLYWEHPDGEKSVRINYTPGSGEVRGFNLMGIRYRHEICEKWIARGTHVEEVLQNLGMANFDPEFYKEYEQDVVDLYNRQTGQQLKLKQRRSLTAALKFLNFKSRTPRATMSSK